VGALSEVTKRGLGLKKTGMYLFIGKIYCCSDMVLNYSYKLPAKTVYHNQDFVIPYKIFSHTSPPPPFRGLNITSQEV
jgi:hypothetical protein